MSYLVVCDGPDPAQAECVGVPAEGAFILGEAMDWADVGVLLSAAALVYATAWGFRTLYKFINPRS